jgi:hypothetical protein
MTGLAADRIEELQAKADVERAYGLLWRSLSDDPLVHAARKKLRDSLTAEQRKAGVAWAVDACGPMSDSELIAADMRAGVFPQRSYIPDGGADG